MRRFHDHVIKAACIPNIFAPIGRHKTRAPCSLPKPPNNRYQQPISSITSKTLNHNTRLQRHASTQASSPSHCGSLPFLKHVHPASKYLILGIPAWKYSNNTSETNELYDPDEFVKQSFPSRDPSLIEQLRLPDPTQFHHASGEIEPSVDDFADANKILQISQLKRRQMLEDDYIAELEAKLTFEERKLLAQSKERFNNTNNVEVNQSHLIFDYLQSIDSLASSQNSDTLRELHNHVTRAARLSLSPQEIKVLNNWATKRQVDKQIIDYLSHDIVMVLKSWLPRNLEHVMDLFTSELPPLILHYFISPFLLNIIAELTFLPQWPWQKQHVGIIEWTSQRWVGFRPLKALSWINSGHWAVDLRVAHFFCDVYFNTLGWGIHRLLSRFPNIFLEPFVRPFAWYLHHYGSASFVRGIVRRSIDQEQFERGQIEIKTRDDYVERRQKREAALLEETRRDLEAYEQKQKAALLKQHKLESDHDLEILDGKREPSSEAEYMLLERQRLARAHPQSASDLLRSHIETTEKSSPSSEKEQPSQASPTPIPESLFVFPARNRIDLPTFSESLVSMGTTPVSTDNLGDVDNSSPFTTDIDNDALALASTSAMLDMLRPNVPKDT